MTTGNIFDVISLADRFLVTGLSTPCSHLLRWHSLLLLPLYSCHILFTAPISTSGSAITDFIYRKLINVDNVFAFLQVMKECERKLAKKKKKILINLQNLPVSAALDFNKEIIKFMINNCMYTRSNLLSLYNLILIQLPYSQPPSFQFMGEAGVHRAAL